MKIVLAGPTLTSSLRSSLGLALPGAPAGTAATPIASLAAGLLALGHAVHIITTDPHVDQPVTMAERGVSITYCPLRGAPKHAARWRMLDLFEKEIRSLTTAMSDARPDIIHAHWTYEFAEAALRTRLPHLITMHDLPLQNLIHFRDAYRLMRLLMAWRTLPRVRNLAVVAPFMATTVRRYGYWGPVTTIPNGVAVPPSLTRPAHGPMNIASIGNPTRLKNIRASVKAFRIVRRRYPDAVLHLFGPGLDAGFVGAEPATIGHGNVDHATLLDFLAGQAHLLIHPSWFESFGVVLAEAKARGVPIVAGRQSGGVPYVCGLVAGCRLVDIDDPDAIAEAALALLANHDDHISEALRQDVIGRFDPRMVAGRYAGLYAEIVGGRA